MTRVLVEQLYSDPMSFPATPSTSSSSRAPASFLSSSSTPMPPSSCPRSSACDPSFSGSTPPPDVAANAPAGFSANISSSFLSSPFPTAFPSRKNVDLLSEEYPMTGVIMDNGAPSNEQYVVAPDYWNATTPPEIAGLPWASGKILTRAPPAIWWEQRERARSKWRQLADKGEMASPNMPFTPRFYSRKVRKQGQTCNPAPGPLGYNSSNPAHWWKWLAKDDVRENEPVSSRLKACGEGIKWKKKIAGKHPASYRWDEEPEPPQDPKEVPKEKTEEERQEEEEAKSEEMLHPGKFTWGQEEWIRRNSMRRPTIDGMPEILGPRGKQEMIPRIERFSDGSEPATFDPRLPRPQAPPTGLEVPADQMDDWLFKAYDGKLLVTGLLGKMSKSMASIDPAKFKAMIKVIKEEPGLIEKIKIAAENHDKEVDAATTATTTTASTSGEDEDGATKAAKAEEEAMKAEVEAQDEAQQKAGVPKNDWTPPARPDFSVEYEERWKKLWPAALQQSALDFKGRSSTAAARSEGVQEVARRAQDFLAITG